jgi:hypothetical protein
VTKAEAARPRSCWVTSKFDDYIKVVTVNVGRRRPRPAATRRPTAGARPGQLVAAAVPHQQLRVELLFQCADLPGQYGLGDVRAVGRAAEVQLFGDSVSELAQVKIYRASLTPDTSRVLRRA